MSKKPVITLDAALQDVEVRFLMNLPESELIQIDRLFFQIEQAWWFYEDFYADANPHLPHYKKMASFAKQIFDHCPLLKNFKAQYAELFADYSAYKSIIPSYGTIMLSPDMKQFVLCQVFGGKTWSFPRGKVNQGESPLACACRETQEETGFDPTPHTKETDYVVWIEGSKMTKLFIATDVPINTHFETQTRKEIADIRYFDIEDVLKGNSVKSWGVVPFYSAMKRWINKHSNQSKKNGPGLGLAAGCGNGNKEKKQRALKKQQQLSVITMLQNAKKLQGQGKAAKGGVQSERKALDQKNTDTFALSPGRKGWSAEAMFKTNAAMTGRTFDEYDGKSHSFGAYHPRYVDFNAAERNSKDALPSPHEVVSHLDVLKKLTNSSSSSNSAASRGSVKLLQRKKVASKDTVFFKIPFKFSMAQVRKVYQQKLNAIEGNKGNRK